MLFKASLGSQLGCSKIKMPPEIILIKLAVYCIQMKEMEWTWQHFDSSHFTNTRQTQLNFVI